MDAQHPQNEKAPAPGRDRPSVDVSRRHFARAELSGSVVLGSLVSKPVLGASKYHCTVSGQISGNLSRPGLAADCQMGDGPSVWAGAASWPTGFVKGTEPSKDCKFNGTLVRGTNFNGYTPGGGVPALTSAFFNEEVGSGSSKACDVTLTQTLNPATMLQVLATTNGSEQFLLGRVVVASLLNAASVVNYPVTAHTIIAMFNVTFGGNVYYPVDGNLTVTWNRARVIEYLASLFKSPA